MDRRKKAVSKLIATTLANLSVIGFGLAIYENRPVALVAGVLAICMAVALEWRSER